LAPDHSPCAAPSRRVVATARQHRRDDTEAKALGIDDTLQKLSRMSGGRDVHVMTFKDAAGVKAKGPSVRIPTQCK
jgi:hypothetical protein